MEVINTSTEFIPEKEKNKNKFIPLCPKCFQVPNIVIKGNNAKMECNCKLSEEEYTIDEYLNLILQKENPIKCKSHEVKNQIITFCIECNEWLCLMCVKNHNKNRTMNNHSFIQSYSIPFCKEHKLEQEIYCEKCNQYLCMECKDKHNKHILYDLKLMSSEINIQNIKNELEIKENMLKEYYIKLKDDYINKVNRAYEEGLKNNRLIIQLGNILLDDYTDNHINNYQLTKNILYYSNLSFKENHEKEDVITYLHNNILLTQFELHKFQLIPQSNDCYYLNKIRILKEETSVYSLLVLKDKRIASCLSDGTINIYNPSENFNCNIRIRAHDKEVYCLSQLEDNKIISCSFDNTIKIWEIGKKAHKCLATLKGHTDSIYKAIPLPNNRIASCSFDKTIKIWNSIDPYQCIQTLTQHKQCLRSLLLMIDHKYLISCSASSLGVWNMDINQITFEKEINVSGCYYCNSLIEIDHKRIAVGWKGIRIVNIINGEIEEEILLNYNISSLLLLRNEKLFSGDIKGMLSVYDEEGKKLQKKKYHEGGINCLVYLNNNIMTCSEDKTIKIWTNEFEGNMCLII